MAGPTGKKLGVAVVLLVPQEGLDGQSEALGRQVSNRMGQTHATVPPHSFLSREDTKGQRLDRGTDA